MAEEQRNSSTTSTFSSERIADTSVYTSFSASAKPEIEEGILDSRDQVLLDKLEELQIADPNVPSERLASGDTNRITSYFCSDTVFNLNNRFLTDIEINVLEKDLNFAPIQRKINEPELRQDFADFCRLMGSGFSETNPHPNSMK